VASSTILPRSQSRRKGAWEGSIYLFPKYFLQLLKAFMQKGRISLFGADFYFLQDQANFWQTDLF